MKQQGSFSIRGKVEYTNICIEPYHWIASKIFFKEPFMSFYLISPTSDQCRKVLISRAKLMRVFHT